MNSTNPTLSSSSTVTPGLAGQILLACCGADRKHLHEGAERNWYYSLGFSVIVTALIAGLSAGMVTTAVTPSASVSIVAAIGLLWAIAVFCLDRLIVSRIHRNKIAAFGARLLLATGVAFVTATGVELILFQSEIDHQVRLDNAQAQRDAIAEWQQNLAEMRENAQSTFAEELARPVETERALVEAIDNLAAALTDANRTLACEIRPADFPPDACTSGTGLTSIGPRARSELANVSMLSEQLAAARERLTAYTINPGDVTGTFTSEELKTCGFSASATALTPKEVDMCSASLLVDSVVTTSMPAPTLDDSVDGPTRRLSAVSALSSGEHGMTIWVLRVLLFIVVASIDLVPLTAKLFGGETSHDLRARVDKITIVSNRAD